MNLRACCLVLAASSAPALAAFGDPARCIHVDPAYARSAAATGGQVVRVQRDEMAKLQPFMAKQLLGGMETVDSTATSLLVSVSMTEDCAPSSQELRLVRPNGLPVFATGLGVKIAEHAMGKIFLVGEPEPGVWKLKAQGSGPTDLVAQVRSEIEFDRFEFVRPGGDIHGGFGKIPGSPVVGSRALGAATLLGETRSVHFRLVDDAGRTLGSPALARNYPSADADDYMGPIALPSVPFRIEASGVDAKGRAFRRVYARQFQAQPVAVDAKGFSVAEVRPGMSRMVTFVVRNLGTSGSFHFLAMNADGWTHAAQPASARLERNQTVEVQVPLAVPASIPPGGDHSIVFTATRADAGDVYNSAVVEVIVLRPDEPEAVRQ